MGQGYSLACKAGEEVALNQAVQFLNERMCAIRDAGKVRGNDRIAVIAALGIAAGLTILIVALVGYALRTGPERWRTGVRTPDRAVSR